MSKYIVKVNDIDTEVFINEDNIPNIVIKQGNIELYNQIITCKLNLKEKFHLKVSTTFELYNNKTLLVTIIFDKHSSSSANNFKTKLNSLINQKYDIAWYKSGNIKLYGKFTNITFIGEEYYDTLDNKVKYKGEMEDNNYDGSGTFFSYDGLFSVHFNNICNNKPNGNK